MAVWYCGSSKYSSAAAWAASTVYTAGQTVRQLAAPTVGSERIFICIVAGTSGGSEPTWVITQGAKTTDNTVTWMECTGKSGVNGDLTNTRNWTAQKAAGTPALGNVIQNNAGTFLFICTTSGALGASQPTFSTTTGSTTTDGSAVWTCIGASNAFAAFANPWARLNLALATGFFIAAADTVYFSHNHGETQSTAISYNAGPNCTIYCVNDGLAPPTTLASTGSITTTGASAITIGSTSNIQYIYGLVVNCGTGSSAANLTLAYLGALYTENCVFNLLTTSATSAILQGFTSSTTSYLEYRNPTITFGATGQRIGFPDGHAYIYGGSIAATGTVPSTLFSGAGAAGVGSEFRVMDCDLSAITGNLASTSGAVSGSVASIENCKLGSGVTALSGSPAVFGLVFKMHNCDSTNTNYRYFYARGFGTAQSETTVVRTGGASDGTTGLSWNINSTSAALFATPFVTEEIAQWNDATGSSKTATIEIASNSTLNNNDVWMEIEYLSSSGSPLGATVNTRMTPLGTPTTLTSSSATWGGSVTNKYKLQASFTPQSKGIIKARIYVAKASAQIYVDPLITVA